jgi:hypothetical protein
MQRSVLVYCLDTKIFWNTFREPPNEWSWWHRREPPRSHYRPIPSAINSIFDICASGPANAELTRSGGLSQRDKENKDDS